jgi:hypothetical protein
LRIVKRYLDKHHPETRVIEGEIVARELSSGGGEIEADIRGRR